MIVVSCAIIVENNRVLATQRSSGMPHPEKWEFPGGKLKGDESPQASIKREILEELGIGDFTRGSAFAHYPSLRKALHKADSDYLRH